MGSSLFGEQTATLVVLHDESDSNQELLGHLAHSSCGKAER